MSATVIIIELLTFCFVVALSVAAFRVAQTQSNVNRRLHNSGNREVGAKKTLVKSETVDNPFLQWVEASTSLNDSKDRDQLRKRLSQAGFNSPTAPVFYVITRFSLAIGLPVALLSSQPLMSHPFTGTTLIAAALMSCFAGLIAPRSFVNNRVNARKVQIEQEFPDALDLLVVCVEAGLGMEAAFIRVGHEVRESHPRISEEFSRMAAELNAGRSRTDALRAMADRADVEQIRSFVALLIQTESLGVSIGQTLRTYSVEMREHRLLKAEEKALRIPVLMTIPLITCILPVIVTTALLPAIIDIVRQVVPALTGVSH